MADVKVKLTDLGDDGDEEARVSFWYVDVGEEVEEGDELVQVITDKATFDVASPVRGRVAEHCVDEDAEVCLGTLLCRIQPAAS